jgi:hypothetical protein
MLVNDGQERFQVAADLHPIIDAVAQAAVAQ